MRIRRLHYCFGGEKHEVWIGKESSPEGEGGVGNFRVSSIEDNNLGGTLPTYDIHLKATHSMDSTEVVMTVPVAMAIAIWR